MISYLALKSSNDKKYDKYNQELEFSSQLLQSDRRHNKMCQGLLH